MAKVQYWFAGWGESGWGASISLDVGARWTNVQVGRYSHPQTHVEDILPN